MCLIIEANQKTKIAEKDIEVWKILTPERRSCLSLTPITYPIGQVVASRIAKSRKHAESHMGWDVLEYWTQKLNVLGFVNLVSDKRVKFIAKGLHVFKSKELAEFHNRNITEVIYRAVIPEGAKYYQDDLGYMVSNKLIVFDAV